jgi:hypothetical protein
VHHFWWPGAGVLHAEKHWCMFYYRGAAFFDRPWQSPCYGNVTSKFEVHLGCDEKENLELQGTAQICLFF